MSDTPQYTYGAARLASHQPYQPSEPVPVPPSEFQVRLTARCEEWRGKFPARADKLRSYVARTMGYSPRSPLSEKLVAAMCAPAEEKIIAIMQGWPATEDEYNAKQEGK